MARGAEIQAAADFVRHTVLRKGAAACGEGGVPARAADQSFDKRSGAPAISGAVEIARPEMVSIEDVLGAANRYDVVAAVRNDL